VDPAEQMRQAIVAAGKLKGIEGAELSAKGTEITGKPVDEWWDNPDALNLILSKIQG
jgi:hypothetical protein